MDIDKKRIADVVRSLRMGRGWDQKELARLAGLSVGTITRLETQKHFPDIRTITKIAKALEMSATELCAQIEGEEYHVQEKDSDYEIVAERAAQRAIEKLASIVGRSLEEDVGLAGG